MPVSKPSDLPKGGGGRWPLCGEGGFRSEQWGDLEVGYTSVSDPVDVRAVYAGLPGQICMCPHYGYVFSGRVRCVFPDSERPDEVASTGEAYFFQAGHYLVYEEPTEALELNPAAALQSLMDHVESTIAKMTEGA